MADFHTNTGTGADFLKLKQFQDASGVTRLMRVATADEEWVVSDWDGEKYFIQFDKNFSKKHLATFSKDHHSNEVAAYFAWENAQKQGQHRGSHDAWEEGEHDMAFRKMRQTLENRLTGKFCNCGHTFGQHTGGGGTCSQCACTRFTTPFAAAREAEGKAVTADDRNPLAGMGTNKNTFILMNYVPRSKFHEVVVRSIQHHEKPTGWSIGQPLACAVNDEKILRWDFGVVGAIVDMEFPGLNPNTTSVAPAPTVNVVTAKLQGCYVKAKKTATDWQKQTWQIFHMETRPPHQPF